jgi:hypothetical protein
MMTPIVSIAILKTTLCQECDLMDGVYSRLTLHARISLSPNIAHKHGHDATSTTQNDMYRHGDIVAKSKVVQQIDGKEHGDIW